MIDRDHSPSDVPGPQGLDEILDCVSDGFAAWDREWRYVHVNRAAATFYGRPREELLGRSVWELYPRAIGTELERQMRCAAVSQEPVELELVSPQFGRWIRYRFFPDERGLSMFFRDVDEEHHTREALRESEARHRSMFEHSLVGWMLTTPDGRVLAANPAACRMLRRTEAEVIAAGRGGVVDATDPRLAAALAERGDTGKVLAELTFVRGDGTRFPALLSSAVFRDARGEERTTVSFYDITERRRAEDTLALLAEAGAVLAGSLDVQHTVDALARFVVPRLADACVVELLQDDARCIAAAHRDPSRGLEHLCARPWRVAIDDVMRTGEAELIEEVDDAWLAHATGGSPGAMARARTCEATSLVLVPLVARGRILGAMALVYTTSERRFDASSLVLARSLAERAALAVDNARHHLAAVEARRVRDDVLSFVAHDLRTPLQAIKISAGLLSMQATTGPALEVIRRSVAQSERLIEDLLTVAMLEGSSLSLERRDAPLTPLVRELIDLHRPLADVRSITLEAHVPVDSGNAWLDPDRILQLLSNLIGNALKFTPSGGRIDVELRALCETIEILVRDTGRGIAAADLPYVFDRFWHSARSRRGGAGLGLAIAEGIARAHGGSLTVESQLGVGTTFCLSLPRHAASAGMIEKRTGPPSVALTR